MSAGISNLAISASAGSGKTFQLAHRYIRLMALGVAPERIVALTFSRKAAGEILDSIVRYLREAAATERQAGVTAGRIGRPEADVAFFRTCLRQLVSSLHRLHVGTLDSFIVGVVRAFPLELGIAPELNLMDDTGTTALEAHRLVLGRIFNSPDMEPGARREFLESLRQATFGQEEKQIERVLGQVIESCRHLLRAAPDADAWGNPGRIWPPDQARVWTESGAIDAPAAATLLRQELASVGWPADVVASVARFADFAETSDEFSAWDDVFASRVMEQVLEFWQSLSAGGVEVWFRKKAYPVPAAVGAPLAELVLRVLGMEIRRALERTRGIHSFLSRYERMYDELVRRQGGLTFTDAQYLLTEANPHSGGAQLSRLADARLYIDYRLDCRLDHWLLDEFQDTSNLQWEVLRNLADEILQDVSGQRSFFYVGDVKQAIYGWRGGNPLLFDRILEQYAGRMARQGLAVSQRSCQAVIDLVNAAFGELREPIPEGVRTRWAGLWERHSCATERVPASGCAMLVEPACPDGAEKPVEEDRFAVAAGVLREIRPLERGLSAAVLVRSNETGRRLADYLRNALPDLPVLHEGHAAIRDNPVVTLLLALVQYATHPGDTLALRHIEMSPLRAALGPLGLDAASLPAALLRELDESGFQAFVRRWGGRLQGAGALEPYERKRLNDLIVASGEFDAQGAHDGDAFIRFIEGYTVHESAREGAVRVMTVHQSKGLEFDVVIVPDLQPAGNSDMLRSAEDYLLACEQGTDAARWVLKSPRRVVAEADPELARQMELVNAASCYEELCVLYVAFTRARRGLYVVTSYPGKTAKSFTPAAFVKNQLTGDLKPDTGRPLTIGGQACVCLHACGDADWHREVQQAAPAAPAAAAAEWPADFGGRASQRRALERVEPSGRERAERSAAWLFAAESRDVLEFGTAIHELFEKVTWDGEADGERLIREWEPTSSCRESIRLDVAEQFRQALRAPEVRGALARPRGDVELWHEKRFDIVLDDAWVSGAFDRVVVVRGPKGRVERAEILDYKSNRIASDAELKQAAETYRGQLELYRRALAAILKCPERRIAARLLFTRVGRVYDL